MHHALRWASERHGEEIGGFPHHPPSKWWIEEDEFQNFHGDRQFRDDIAGVRRLQYLARQAEGRARALAARNRDGVRAARKTGRPSQNR
jgi:hypothetical protein